MKKMISFLAVLVLVLGLVPAFAGADENVVNVYNWYDYMDESVFDIFYEETGIRVNKVYFTTNEDMMIQLRVSPGAYDVVIPSDYCVERMIREGLIQKINFDNIPNVKYIMPDLLNPDYDPESAYTVPFMWGTVGILYNTTMVPDEATETWNVMWDEKYADSIFMMDSIRDTLMVAQKLLGYDINTVNLVELNAVKEKLIQQKPLVKAYYVDETKDKMVKGEAALALVYSGDALYAMEKNPDLNYTVPNEGSNIWVDPMVIPADAAHKENAEKLINFLCRPDIAKMNCEYIYYSSPNAGAIELMGEDYTENSTINPSSEVIERCQYYHDLDDKYQSIYNNFWSQVKGTN